MGVKATLLASIAALVTNAADIATAEYDPQVKKLIELASGTGSGQADVYWDDERTLAASATENLDLAGSLTNALGQAATFVTVKAILIIADSGNTNDVIVGGAGSNTFVGPFADATDKLAVRPGGFAFLAAPKTGWTVTAATGDILKVANSGGTTGVTYKVIIIGTSA